MNRVLVTGATGFVGRPLIEALISRGLVVRAAVRRDTAELPTRASENFVVGDISSKTDWSAALHEVDAVVHLAARVHAMKDGPEAESLYVETNCNAVLNLAEAAVHADVRRFVFLSSIKVNGEASGESPFRPSDTPNPLDAYGRSKLMAEQGLQRLSTTRGLETVVIRPPLVYGPHVKANFLRLMSWVNRGWPLPFGSVNNARSLVSVWNLCDLICHTLDASSAPGRTWLVSDGESLSTAELIRRLAAHMGIRDHLVRVPPAILMLAGGLMGRGPELRRLCGTLVVDSKLTESVLHWTPPLSVDEGLARTVTWFQSRGEHK